MQTEPLAVGDIIGLSRNDGLRGRIVEIQPGHYLVSSPAADKIVIPQASVIGRLHDGAVGSKHPDRDINIFLDAKALAQLGQGRVPFSGLLYGGHGKLRRMMFSIEVDDKKANAVSGQIAVDFLDGAYAVFISSEQLAKISVSGKAMQCRYDSFGSKIDVYSEQHWMAERDLSGCQETLALYIANWDRLDASVKES